MKKTISLKWEATNIDWSFKVLLEVPINCIILFVEEQGWCSIEHLMALNLAKVHSFTLKKDQMTYRGVFMQVEEGMFSLNIT